MLCTAVAASASRRSLRSCCLLTNSPREKGLRSFDGGGAAGGFGTGSHCNSSMLSHRVASAIEPPGGMSAITGPPAAISMAVMENCLTAAGGVCRGARADNGAATSAAAPPRLPCRARADNGMGSGARMWKFALWPPRSLSPGLPCKRGNTTGPEPLKPWAPLDDVRGVAVAHSNHEVAVVAALLTCCANPSCFAPPSQTRGCRGGLAKLWSRLGDNGARPFSCRLELLFRRMASIRCTRSGFARLKPSWSGRYDRCSVRRTKP
mmetsp:Transcript_49988/g.143912  ORF Transcript_49988/g.143912 Transcript_49988/m.143912 type:complete len:264 (+) Transcript_49988:883-1674(+)